jgi:hypothetical protein
MSQDAFDKANRKGLAKDFRAAIEKHQSLRTSPRFSLKKQLARCRPIGKRWEWRRNDEAENFHR